jgi:hypothetical protein
MDWFWLFFLYVTHINRSMALCCQIKIPSNSCVVKVLCSIL